MTFRDKDLVVFLGDSITEDNAYAGILPTIRSANSNARLISRFSHVFTESSADLQNTRSARPMMIFRRKFCKKPIRPRTRDKSPSCCT